MKFKFIVIAGFSLICTLLISAQLYALGLGVYGTGSKSNTTWTYHKDEIPDYDVDSKDSKIGGGFVLDTCLANDRLFNYRLNIGFNKVNIDNDKNTFTSVYGVKDVKGNDYHLYNSFGFGIFRSDYLRFWAGLQIGLGYFKGEYDVSSTTGDGDNTFWTIFFSGGLVAGLNIHAGDIVTFAFDGGYRIKKHLGTADTGTSSLGVTGNVKELFANVSFILRINDFFPTD